MGAELHSADEWHEGFGACLWWRFPVREPPYVGTPLDVGHTVEMRHYIGGEGEIKTIHTDVGGWPGYHTHFQIIEVPDTPRDPALAGQDQEERE